MSMNLHICAEGMAMVPNKKGRMHPKKTTQTFPLWQTPTAISYAIEKEIGNQKRFEAYSKWVREIHSDDGEEHLEDLAAWMSLMTQAGLTVEFYVS